MTTLGKQSNRKSLISSIPLLLFFMLGCVASQKTYYFLSVLPLLCLFYLHTYFLIPVVLKEKGVLIYGLSIVLISMGLSSYHMGLDLHFSSYFSPRENFYEVLGSPWPYHPFKREALLSILSTLGISSIYAYIQHLFTSGRTNLLRKIGIYTFILASLIVLSLGTKYIWDTSWEGNSNIQFLESETFESLEEVLQLPQFKNQWVYVDLWYSSCGPCIAEFKHLPELKKRLAKKSIQYLYLAHETSRPHDRQLWKNAIKKYDLKGYHLFMSPEFDDRIWAQITHETDIPARYPHFLLIGKDGKILTYDAARPSDPARLLTQMELID